jgi:hypothetical protein
MNLRNPLIIVSATASVVAVLTAYDSNLYYATTPLISLSVVLLCASLLDFGTEKNSRQEIDALRKQLHDNETNQRFSEIENSIHRNDEYIRQEISHSIKELRDELRSACTDYTRNDDSVRNEISRLENHFEHKIDNLVRDVSIDIATNNRNAGSINS